MSDKVTSKCKCPNCGQKVEYPWEMGGQRTNCPTCQHEFKLFDPFKSGTKRDKNSLCRRISKQALRDIRQTRLQWVKILGCGIPGEDCAACLALKGKAVPIDSIESLPLPGCTLVCKCCIGGALGP